MGFDSQHRAYKLLLKQAGSYISSIKPGEFEFDGNRSRYLELGDGAALIFLHGLAGSKNQWRILMQAFGRKFRVIAPDVPGLCLTAPLQNSRHTFKQLTRWLDCLIDTLQLTDVHLVSHSTSAPFASVYCADQPERVSRLVLMSFPDVLAPTFSGQGEAYVKYREEVNFQSMEEWDAFFKRSFYQPLEFPTVMKRYNFDKFKKNQDLFLSVIDDVTAHQPLVMPRLRRIQARTLVLNGDHDNFSNADFCHTLQAHLTKARHITLSESGHMMVIDQRAKVTTAQNAFFLQPSI